MPNRVAAPLGRHRHLLDHPPAKSGDTVNLLGVVPEQPDR
jgi:hypothetical protein